MLAALLPRAGAPIEVREIPEPELESNSALLDVALSEVCGTDVYLQQGLLKGVPYPIIPGHVTTGYLSKVRGQVLDVNGQSLVEGDPVTFLDVHKTCNACWYCLVAKATTRCPHRKVYGITYGLADGPSGGWAQKLCLKPNTRCIRLKGDSFERFMVGGCALPTALHAVERADLSLGDTVLILGSGPVALSVIIFTLMRGALRVLCLGAPEVRLATARSLGASATLDLEMHTEAEREQWVQEQTNGRGADVTIEATGAPVAVVQAMRYTRDAGRVIIVGQYTDHGKVAFNPHLDLNMKHLDIRGCWGSDFSHFYRGVQIITDPVRSAAWSLIKPTHYSLKQMNEALFDVSAGKVIKALVAPQKF
jgi:L-iditol 2-dehydrogenase